jgi:hypothetical protein
LIPACGANAQLLLSLPTLDPEFARWIREVSTGAKKIQPCQGDLNPAGEIFVEPEHNNACAFRGDYDLLFGLA